MGIDHGHIAQVILVGLISAHVAFSEPDLLPPPKNISINSTNLIHVLHWEPEPEVQGIVNYSVQIQGFYFFREYERLLRNGTWSDVEHCQNITQTHCDVTNDVAGNVFYSFRVQSLHGDRISVWEEIKPFFNRVISVLTTPAMTLQLSGLNLIANIQDYGENFQFFVYFWQKGKEGNEKSIKMNRETTSALLGKIEAGSEYCAYVIAHAIPISRNSNKSNPVCVRTPGPGNAGFIIGLLCLLSVPLVLVALAAWKALRLMHYSCCPQEDLPNVLKKPYPDRKMVDKYYSGQDECQSMSRIQFDELVSQENYLKSRYPGDMTSHRGHYMGTGYEESTLQAVEPT